MAYVTDFRIGGVSVGQRLDTLRTELRTRIANYATYRTTLGELRNLSRRELDDMGLSQHSLRDIAYESAYGKK